MKGQEISIEAVWFQDDRIIIRTESSEERTVAREYNPKIFLSDPAKRVTGKIQKAIGEISQ